MLTSQTRSPSGTEPRRASRMHIFLEESMTTFRPRTQDFRGSDWTEAQPRQFGRLFLSLVQTQSLSCFSDPIRRVDSKIAESIRIAQLFFPCLRETTKRDLENVEFYRATKFERPRFLTFPAFSAGSSRDVFKYSSGVPGRAMGTCGFAKLIFITAASCRQDGILGGNLSVLSIRSPILIQMFFTLRTAIWSLLIDYFLSGHILVYMDRIR